MENPVDRFKQIELRESSKLIERRKTAWSELKETSNEIANDLVMLSKIFGKPKLINVKCNSGKTWKWAN